MHGYMLGLLIIIKVNNLSEMTTHRSDSFQDRVPSMNRWSSLSRIFYLQKQTKNKQRKINISYHCNCLQRTNYWIYWTDMLLTKWIVAGHWKLHGGFALGIDNIKPLYCFNIAKLMGCKLYTPFENFCKSKQIQSLILSFKHLFIFLQP